MLRQIALTRSTKPGHGVGRRAGTLVAASGPYSTRIERTVEGSRVRQVAFGSSLAALRVAMTTGPHSVVRRAAGTSAGIAATPEQAAAQRRTVLAGTAATIATGLVVQRIINHSAMSGPVADAGRMLGSQLAIGGAATALVLGTDTVLRHEQREVRATGGGVLTLGGMAVLAQSRALKRVAPILTLPTAPRTVSIPVRGRWRTRTVTLPIAR